MHQSVKYARVLIAALWLLAYATSASAECALGVVEQAELLPPASGPRSSGDLLLLKELGGWSSLSMVQRNAHLREGRGAEAIRKMLADRERALSPATSPRRVTGRPRSA